MPVAFDAVMLSLYLHPTAKPPKPVPDLVARIKLLIDELEADGAKIIIATPILSEFLVLAGPVDGPRYLTDLTNTEVFDVQPFDTMAAVEAAEMQRKAKDSGDKRAGSKQRWQVVKVDRQFVAIAKVHNVGCIYSDDDGVQKMAKAAGIECKGVQDLPVPPIDPQANLFDPPDVSPSSEPELPSAQPAADAKKKGTQPASARRGGHPADQERQQRGPSPGVVPRPRSKK